MNQIREIERINRKEAEAGVPDTGSWHAEYKHSAYVIASGLDYRLSEGDLIVVFSQCGEVVDLNLIRDQKTGKSKGFAFIAYEDQRSTVLAVDNFNGAKLCGRLLRVDHVRQYRRPETSLKAGSEGVNETDEDYDTRRRRIWPYTPDTRSHVAPPPPPPPPPSKVAEQAPAANSAPEPDATAPINEDAQMARIEAIRLKRKQRLEELLQQQQLQQQNGTGPRYGGPRT